MWGPSIASLKGKTTRQAPPAVQTDIIKIPTEIRELHRFVTLSIDVFFINKIPFFITLSRKICFTTVTHLANRRITTIFAALKSIFMYYLQKGFQIMTITGDNEFAPLAELLFYELPGAPTLNLTSANEHKPYIEHHTSGKGTSMGSLTFCPVQGHPYSHAHPHGFLCGQTAQLFPYQRWNIDAI